LSCELHIPKIISGFAVCRHDRCPALPWY
jgi:hypothetical protein